jgi:hypothetical protein
MRAYILQISEQVIFQFCHRCFCQPEARHEHLMSQVQSYESPFPMTQPAGTYPNPRR